MQGNVVYDESRKVDIAFVENENALIELVCPREGSEDVGESLRKLGSIPYHLCYECDDLGETIQALENDGCMLVKAPQNAMAINDRKVAFMYSGSLGLFELIESE